MLNLKDLRTIDGGEPSRAAVYMYKLVGLPSRAFCAPRTLLGCGPLDLARILPRKTKTFFQLDKVLFMYMYYV